MTVRRPSFLAAALLLGCAVVAAGCTDQTGSSSDTTKTTTASAADQTTIGAPTANQAPTTTAVTAPALVPWGQPGSYEEADGSKWEVVLYEPETIPDSFLMADKEADKLVAMLVEISNTGTVAFDVGQDWFRLQDTEDFVYTWTYTNQQTKPELYFVTVNPGQKVNGYMIYQIPEATQPKAGLCRPSSGTGDSPQLIWSE